MFPPAGCTDFSGEFAFTIGLPAKRRRVRLPAHRDPGPHGSLRLVSQARQNTANSVRGVEFCRRPGPSATTCTSSTPSPPSGLGAKRDPRRTPAPVRHRDRDEPVAGGGRQRRPRRDPPPRGPSAPSWPSPDYDGRTALHVASRQGQLGPSCSTSSRPRRPSRPSRICAEGRRSTTAKEAGHEGTWPENCSRPSRRSPAPTTRRRTPWPATTGGRRAKPPAHRIRDVRNGRRRPGRNLSTDRNRTKTGPAPIPATQYPDLDITGAACGIRAMGAADDDRLPRVSRGRPSVRLSSSETIPCTLI